MTEAEWLRTTEPDSMLFQVSEGVTERKLRLFVCACWEHVRRMIGIEWTEEAIQVAERYVDGLADIHDLRTACAALRDSELDAWGGDMWTAVAVRTARLATESPLPINAVWHMTKAIWETGHEADERVFLCRLLRDIFGNPFRPVAVDHAWLRWNGDTVGQLAQLIYDGPRSPAGEFDRGRLGILADALEDAGCTDADILDHLRGSGPHVRGCWVVDLLLGKG